MKSIDSNVLAGYNAGVEKDRLKSGLGLIEFERTWEILLEFLPLPPAVIYDIGGGYGEYSCRLALLGYDVYLYDISEKNIEMSKLLRERTGASLCAAEVADARSIPRPDGSADAVLLMGPLYHIVEREERRLALVECRRLLKSGGLLFTSAITRYATTLWAVTTYDMNRLLDEPEFFSMIVHEIKTGDHIKKHASRYRGMGRSYFHLPGELKEEIDSAGFCGTEVRGVIGPCWLIPGLDEAWKDPEKRESIMRVVRMCEKEESIMGLSTHILTISRKGDTV